MSQEERDAQHVAELQGVLHQALELLQGRPNGDCMVVLANIVTQFCNNQDDPDGAFLQYQQMLSTVYRKVRDMRREIAN